MEPGDVAEHDELARRLVAAPVAALDAARRRSPASCAPGARRCSAGPRRCGASRRERRRGRSISIAPIRRAGRRELLAASSPRSPCGAGPRAGSRRCSSGSPSASRRPRRPARRGARAARCAACAAGPRAARGGRDRARAGTRRGTRGRTARAPRGAPRASCAASSRRRPAASSSTAVEAAQRVGEAARRRPRCPASRSTRPKVTTSRIEASLTAPAAAATARASRTSSTTVSSRTMLEVLAVLEDRPERLLDRHRVEPLAAQDGERVAQSIVSATPGGLARSSTRRPATNAAACAASRSDTPGTRRRDDLDLALERRVASSSGTGSGA